MEEEVIITNNDRLVLEQWKSALNRPRTSGIIRLQTVIRAERSNSHSFKTNIDKHCIVLKELDNQFYMEGVRS